MVSPTVAMLGQLLVRQGGKPIQRPATGKAGTLIGTDQRPQTHMERQYSSQPVYEQAGDVIPSDVSMSGLPPGNVTFKPSQTPVRQVQTPQSKLVKVDEDRLTRDVTHQWPESRRGQLPESQVIVDQLRMLMIGHEQGLTPTTSPMMKNALEYIKKLEMTDAELANYARNARLIPGTGEGAGVTSELGSLHRRGALSPSDQGGPLERYTRNLAAGESPKEGFTTSWSNIYEVLLRRQVEGGVPPQRARDITYDVLSQGSPEIAAQGQKSFEAGIRNMLKQKKDFPYEKELIQSGQLLGAGRSGGSGPSEMNMLRMILGQPVAKGTREATAEAAALRGGPIGENIGAGIFYGTPKAMGPQRGTAFTDKLRRGAEEARQADVAGARGAEPGIPPKSTDPGGRFEQMKNVTRKGPPIGPEHAVDPNAVPFVGYGKSTAGTSQDPGAMIQDIMKTRPKHQTKGGRPSAEELPDTIANRAFIEQKFGKQAAASQEIRPDEILGSGRFNEAKLKRGDTMDLEGDISKAETQTQQMFDLKNRVDDQLDDLAKSTRGVSRHKEGAKWSAREKSELGEVKTFRNKIEQTKKALAAAYEKQDFEKVVEISHRVDEGNLADIAVSPAVGKEAFKQVAKREGQPQPPTKQATSDKMDRLKGERLLKDTGVKPSPTKKIQYASKPSKELTRSDPAPNDIEGWKKWASDAPETKQYGLEWEVETWFDKFIKQGKSPEQAAVFAIAEWIK